MGSLGTSSFSARQDHQHDHGQLTSSLLHAAATTSSAGFLSAADKLFITALPASITASLNTLSSTISSTIASINFDTSSIVASVTALSQSVSGSLFGISGTAATALFNLSSSTSGSIYTISSSISSTIASLSSSAYLYSSQSLNSFSSSEYTFVSSSLASLSSSISATITNINTSTMSGVLLTYTSGNYTVLTGTNFTASDIKTLNLSGSYITGTTSKILYASASYLTSTDVKTLFNSSSYQTSTDIKTLYNSASYITSTDGKFLYLSATNANINSNLILTGNLWITGNINSVDTYNREVWVVPYSASVQANGTKFNPFNPASALAQGTTPIMQAAHYLMNISNANAQQENSPKIIHVYQGRYDESITISGSEPYEIIYNGGVRFGNIAGAGEQRQFTCTKITTPLTYSSIGSSIQFGILKENGILYGAFNYGGPLILITTGSVTTSLYLENTTFDSISSSLCTGSVVLEQVRGNYRGRVNFTCTSAIIKEVDFSQALDLSGTTPVRLFEKCIFRAPLTISAGYTALPAGLSRGFLNCEFKSGFTFSGPTGSAQFDAVTYRNFLTSSGVFIGGASTDDFLIPSTYASGSFTNLTGTSLTGTTALYSSASIGILTGTWGNITNLTGTEGKFLYLSATNANISGSLFLSGNLYQSGNILTTGSINAFTGNFLNLTATNDIKVNGILLSASVTTSISTLSSTAATALTTQSSTMSTYVNSSISTLSSSVYAYASSSLASFSGSEYTFISSSIASLSSSFSSTIAKLQQIVQIQVSDPNGSAISVGDGKAYLYIPSEITNYNLINAQAAAFTGSTSGIPTFQIRKTSNNNNMLSTAITIDIGDNPAVSNTAAIPSVIDLTNDDVQTGELISVDIDVAGTGVKGLMINLTFQSP